MYMLQRKLQNDTQCVMEKVKTRGHDDFSCRATEPGLTRDIGTMEIDWLIDWLYVAECYKSPTFAVMVRKWVNFADAQKLNKHLHWWMGIVRSHYSKLCDDYIYNWLIDWLIDKIFIIH